VSHIHSAAESHSARQHRAAHTQKSIGKFFARATAAAVEVRRVKAKLAGGVRVAQVALSSLAAFYCMFVGFIACSF